MSPIPPNKESNSGFTSNRNISQNNDDLNMNNLNNENDEDQYEFVENGEELTNEDYNQYSELSQQAASSNVQENNSEDESDENDDSDDDSEQNVDVDFDFELLASSRASQKRETNDSQTQCLASYSILETDVFERKNILECEEIHLDENKSKVINNLMSNFKLPEKCIPEWAKLIPENVWKANLIDSLNAKKTDLFDNKNESNLAEN